jgi:uncharacterized protein
MIGLKIVLSRISNRGAFLLRIQCDAKSIPPFPTTTCLPSYLSVSQEVSTSVQDLSHFFTGIFQHPMLVLHDDRMAYGEERWITIGLIKTLIGVVVYTERRDDVIRIISARKATKQEAIRDVENIEN